VQHEHACARSFDRKEESLVVQQGDLAAGPAEAFDAMRSRGEEQHCRRVGDADLRDVDRKLLADARNLSRASA
jgi:hypothetical protein